MNHYVFDDEEDELTPFQAWWKNYDSRGQTKRQVAVDAWNEAVDLSTDHWFDWE